MLQKGLQQLLTTAIRYSITSCELIVANYVFIINQLQALIFFGEVLLFMNWAPVGDMVLVRHLAMTL